MKKVSHSGICAKGIIMWTGGTAPSTVVVLLDGNTGMRKRMWDMI